MPWLRVERIFKNFKKTLKCIWGAITEQDSLKSRLRSYSSEKSKLTTPSGDSTSILPTGREIPIMEITNSEPKSLEEMITALTTTVNSIKVDITDLKNSKSNISNLEALCSSNRDTIQDVADHVESDSLKIKLLTAIVIRQDNRIKSLEREMIELKKDSRKANLVISGIDETPQDPVRKQFKRSLTFYLTKWRFQMT